VRPKANGAGLICRTDQYFQRQFTASSEHIKAWIQYQRNDTTHCVHLWSRRFM